MTAQVPTLVLFVLVCIDRPDTTSGQASGGYYDDDDWSGYYQSGYYWGDYHYDDARFEGDTSSLSEGACNENVSCTDAILYNPPVGAPRGNPVSVSWVITDMDAMDETAGTISVNTDIQMWWMDCRWPKLVRNVDDLRLTGEMRTMTGATPLWHAAALGVVTKYGPYLYDGRSYCGYSPTVFWTPVPRRLFPKTADNPESITKGDLFIRNLNHEREGWHMALLLDEDPVQLTYSFDYTSYPFDKQVMDLILKFDPYTSPTISTSIETSSGAEDLSYISVRTTVPYEASSFSPHLTQTAVDAFQKKGWHVTGADLESVATGTKVSLRFRIKLAREWMITLPRFFIPLFALTAISLAAFFLPLTQVMPRVAVGFVSFLSLAVFRSQAYSMLPKTPSSLVWLDVAMLTITEIMWVAVVLNIFALSVNTFYSRHAAQFVDKVIRRISPLTNVIVLTLMFAAGSANVEPFYIMIYYTHLPLAASLVVTFVIIGRYLWCLPSVLLRTLAQELADEKLVWKDGVNLEQRELALVFRHIDDDNTGEVTPDETANAFEKAGLKFRSQEDRDLFRQHVSSVPGDTEMGLDEFRGHFTNLLGGVLVRRLHSSRSAPANASEMLENEPQQQLRERVQDATAAQNASEMLENEPQQQLRERVRDATAAQNASEMLEV